MPFKPLVTAGIEGLLNTFLYRSPALKSARTRLQGKVLCVKLKGFSMPLVPYSVNAVLMCWGHGRRSGLYGNHSS